MGYMGYSPSIVPNGNSRSFAETPDQIAIIVFRFTEKARDVKGNILTRHNQNDLSRISQNVVRSIRSSSFHLQWSVNFLDKGNILSSFQGEKFRDKVTRLVYQKHDNVGKEEEKAVPWHLKEWRELVKVLVLVIVSHDYMHQHKLYTVGRQRGGCELSLFEPCPPSSFSCADCSGGLLLSHDASAPDGTLCPNRPFCSSVVGPSLGHLRAGIRLDRADDAVEQLVRGVAPDLPGQQRLHRVAGGQHVEEHVPHDDVSRQGAEHLRRPPLPGQVLHVHHRQENLPATEAPAGLVSPDRPVPLLPRPGHLLQCEEQLCQTDDGLCVGSALRRHRTHSPGHAVSRLPRDHRCRRSLRHWRIPHLFLVLHRERRPPSRYPQNVAFHPSLCPYRVRGLPFSHPYLNVLSRCGTMSW